MNRAPWLARVGLAAALAASALSARSLRAQASPADAPDPDAAIVVHGLRPARDVNQVSISAAEARAVAGTQGDPAKIVESMPGLARTGFGSGQLVLWGAAPAETRIYVDGVEIPRLFHPAAIRSTVPGDLIGDIAVTPGAYGPADGRGLGGIVRLETRELDQGLHAALDASTLDGSLLLGSAVGSRVRMAVAARAGWLDRIWSALHAPDIEPYVAIPRYSDYFAKAQFQLSEDHALALVLLGSADAFTQTAPSDDPARVRSALGQSAFQRLWVRYQGALEDGSSVEIVPWVGRDTSRYAARFGPTPSDLREHTLRYGMRAEQRSQLGPGTRLGLGIDIAAARAELSRDGSLTIPAREGDVSVFGQAPAADTNADRWRAGVVDIAPYLSFDVALGPWLLSPGLRFQGYLIDASRTTPRIGQTPGLGRTTLDASIEPRLSARLRLRPGWALSAALGRYSQPPAAQDLSAVFGTPTLGVESALHASVAGSLDIRHRLVATLTGFYRALSHLAVRDPSPAPRLANALLERGTGHSLGLQLMLRQQPWRGWSGWLAYTLSRSVRRDTAEQSTRLFDHDEPHLLTLVCDKMLGRWTLGLRFRYARGAPRTPVASALYDEHEDVYQPIFGAHNAIRLPDFWQLDLRVERWFALGASARLVVYLEALNLTDHANGEEYSYATDYSQRGLISGLPLFGVIGARLEL